MRSRTAPDLAGRCPACRLRIERCLCDTVQRLETRTRVAVVRHVLEAPKSTNTARLAALALPSLEILNYGAHGAPLDESAIARGETWLLMPGSAPQVPEGRPDTLVVLDGSWTQVRGMLARIRTLHALPKFSLPPPTHVPLRARHAPLPEQLTTIEAIAGALEIVEPGPSGTALRTLADEFATRVLSTRGTLPSRTA